MQALTSRFTKKSPSGLRPEGRISAVPPSFTSEHIYTYKLECLLSCNVDESEELMSNLVIYRFNFLGSSAQKLPSMISVLSIFQPAQNVSPSYGPDALSESFRHVLLFLMPLNICLFLSTILKCIGGFVNMIFAQHSSLRLYSHRLLQHRLAVYHLYAPVPLP